MRRHRVYLAGPDVFFPDAVAVGARKKAICSEHGFEGVFPLDAEFDLAGLPPPEQGYRCFDAMIELMESCDFAIANLTPFRGPSMDVGTAVEIGYMHGRGRPVFGYTNVATSYAERVAPDRFLIEPFDLVDNLMVEGPIHSSGVHVIRSSVPSEEIYASVEGFSACVALAAEFLADRGPGGHSEGTNQTMRDTLKPGIRHEFTFEITDRKTVPALYPESPEFQVMPRVFATGYLVGLIEWTCIQAIAEHIDWPREQTVGTHLDIGHSAPTPPGCPVTVAVELFEVDGRRLRFRVSARDDVGVVSDGVHERFVIDAERFNAKLSSRRRDA